MKPKSYCTKFIVTTIMFLTLFIFSTPKRLYAATNGWDPTCDGGNGIDTAIGCIHFNSNESFSGDLFGWAIGISGGVAFLLIVYSSFIIMTSQGDPNRLKAGQELLTAAISGTILLVLSVVVLKFVGVDILGLDRWGFGK